MKNFRSISDLKIKCLAHPRVLELQQQCQSLWHDSYYSAQAVWYMIASFILMLILFVQWTTQQYHVLADFKESFALLQQQASQKPAQQNNQLGGERLFGQPMSYSAQQALSHAFHLEGILYDNEPSKRSAVLKDNSGTVKFYHQGDKLPGGANLVNIGQDFIEIESQGFHQHLKLERYPASFLSDEPLNSDAHLLSE